MIGRDKIAQRLQGWIFVGVDVFFDTFLPVFFFLFFSFALRVHEAFYFRVLPLRYRCMAPRPKPSQTKSYHIISSTVYI